jgi:hypothetical protein
MRFNMNNVKSINIPLAFNFKLYSSLCFSNKEENDYISCVPCASVVRSLMYAMVCVLKYCVTAKNILIPFCG